MTLLQLNYLTAIAQSGSINKAAKRLFISQSGMSAAVRELEEEMGITIFRRTNRGVVFTDEGYAFYEAILPIIRQERRVMDVWAGKKRGPTERLVVSSQHYPFAVQAFVTLLGQMEAEQYDLRLRESDTGKIIRDVAEGESDLGLLFLSNAIREYINKILRAENLEFHLLGQLPPHAYFRAGHPLGGRMPLTMDALGQYPYVSFETGAGESPAFSEEIVLPDFTPPGKRIYVDDRKTIYSVLLGSDAYSIGSGLLPPCYSDPGIVAREISQTGDLVQLGWLCRRGGALSPLAARYVALLEGCIDSPRILP